MTYLPGSYQQGFAPRDFEPRFPELWRGRYLAWNPSLGSTGLVLREWAGCQKHGVLSNMTAVSAWTIGRPALEFTHTTGPSRQAVEIPSSASVKGFEIAAISLWINLKSPPSANSGIYYESTSTDTLSRFSVFQTTSNDIGFACRDTASGSAFLLSTAATSGQWLHVVGQYNSLSDLMSLWINGSLVATNTAAKGPLHNSDPAAQIAIGAFTQNTTPGNQSSCNALVDDLAIYRRELHPTEILTLAQRRGISYEPRIPNYAETAEQFLAAWLSRQSTIIGGGVA